MTEKLLRLQQDISSLPCRENLVSVLVYGTTVSSNDIANDLDVVIVAKKVDSSLKTLFELLSSESKNLDFNLYSKEEFFNDLSYYTREFKLEYLAKGFCVYGINIFEQEYRKVNKYSYRQSILIRSIEYLQMVRQRYFSAFFDPDQKLRYFKKYFLRISKSILLFKGVCDHSSVNNMADSEIMGNLFDLGIFSVLPNLEEARTLEEYFNLFDIISDALIKCKKEFDFQAPHAPLRGQTK